jgi:DNA-binding transcriptional regulator YiaG
MTPSDRDLECETKMFRANVKVASTIHSYIVGVVTATELRNLRRRLGLTQTALADLVGVPSNTIARWERDEMAMRPAMDRLIRLTVAEADRKRKTRKRS